MWVFVMWNFVTRNFVFAGLSERASSVILRQAAAFFLAYRRPVDKEYSTQGSGREIRSSSKADASQHRLGSVDRRQNAAASALAVRDFLSCMSLVGSIVGWVVAVFVAEAVVVPEPEWRLALGWNADEQAATPSVVPMPESND